MDSAAVDPLARVERVRRKHSGRLMRLANVVGVGVGLRRRSGATLDEVALVVLVSEKVAAESLAEGERIPAEIEGVPVDVVAVGEIGDVKREPGEWGTDRRET